MLQDPAELTTAFAAGPGRIALVLEYDGSGFHGWQDQKSGLRTIGGTLASAVSKVANEPVTPVCAGRTDSGVHACYQPVHFDTGASRAIRSWVLGINSALPGDIRVHWAGQATPDFSARFTARCRRYRYVMLDTPTAPALLRGRVAWTHTPLDRNAMQKAAQYLMGEQDFSAFRAAGCQANSPWRCIQAITVYREGPFLVLDITANAFLHHMVRNIAGTLMAVGHGERQPEWVAGVLREKDRRSAGVTAPAQGLYLVDVCYPAENVLPRPRLGPWWLGPPP
ncbi:tRNA pseudouridine(38-40) synthase TruA [Salicola sp. Rm-C-2C1-2]|uniref:tRNA pseudouridine(38-40) synthase TruA n=1 Tax=Salicola sp. Rm-C-2C1-2 TaxID=3141321 RepID=UPI0032E4B36E